MRRATHAGSWYTANGGTLSREINELLAKSQFTYESRFLIGPHAGYRFCGEVLANSYHNISSTTKTVVLMGPSHFEYFRGIKTTKFTEFDTPLGAVKINNKLTSLLISNGLSTLSEATDLKEHSWEMHLPFLKTVLPNASIVPLLFGSNSTLDCLGAANHELLCSLFANPQVAFVVSSDFCHWGASFGYQPFASKGPLIYRHIKKLDYEALETLGEGGSQAWKEYILSTKNTICGEKPIMFLLELGEACNTKLQFKTVKYAQSSKVRNPNEMSVSYAAAYAL